MTTNTSTTCTCTHVLGFHGFPGSDGVVLQNREQPCAWGHVWPTLNEVPCHCESFVEHATSDLSAAVGGAS